LPLSVGRLGGQGVEQFGRSEPLVSGLEYHLFFLDHVHEFDSNQGVLGCLTRFEPQHGPCHPLYTSMILLHDVVEIFHLTDDDIGAMCLVVALDGGCIGVTAVDGDLLRASVAADGFFSNRSAASLSRCSVSRKSLVWPCFSTARESARHWPFTLMYVSSIRQLIHTGRWRRWNASSSCGLYLMTHRFMVE